MLQEVRDNQPTSHAMIDHSHAYLNYFTPKADMSDDSSSGYTSISANAAINDPSSSSCAIIMLQLIVL